jgi:hypothetical protein
MSSQSSGRPKGTQNKPGYSAGGSRAGAGRKRKAQVDGPESTPTDEGVKRVVNVSHLAMSGEDVL